LHALLVFGSAYFFTDQIKAIVADVHRAERWLGLAGLLALAAMLVVGVWRWPRRVGKDHRRRLPKAFLDLFEKTDVVRYDPVA
jgi:membrane protein implicated in regulation of membrane protease activity